LRTDKNSVYAVEFFNWIITTCRDIFLYIFSGKIFFGEGLTEVSEQLDFTAYNPLCQDI